MSDNTNLVRIGGWSGIAMILPFAVADPGRIRSKAAAQLSRTRDLVSGIRNYDGLLS